MPVSGSANKVAWNPPGVDERHDEEDGQHAVEQDLEGVVHGGIVRVGDGLDHLTEPAGQVLDLFRDLIGALGAQGGQQAQIPGAHEHHVSDKDYLEQQEQEAPQDLTPGDAAEAHDEIGKLGLPVAFHKGGPDILRLVGDAQPDLLEEAADALEEIPYGYGDGGEEAEELILEPFPFGKL